MGKVDRNEFKGKEIDQCWKEQQDFNYVLEKLVENKKVGISDATGIISKLKKLNEDPKTEPDLLNERIIQKNAELYHATIILIECRKKAG